ncbi:MAG: 3-deoxy-manno-octulosonate cytidylyltransferase [Candidatus Gracilibacteria bacterium]
MSLKSLLVLPCRLGSTRLPEKHLIELSNGKTIFQMAYENCIKSKVDKVLIATDHEKIYKRAESFTSDVIMTSHKHTTGSDRVAEVAKMYPDYKIIINVQGDEPLISHTTINSLINSLIHSTAETVMCTVSTKFNSIEELKKADNVKVISDINNNAIYFSRNVIPYNKDIYTEPYNINIDNYRKHLGIYAYKRDFLLKYVQMKQTSLEKTESLEQLRIIENGYKIGIIQIENGGIGIDTQEDLDAIELILQIK